MKQPSTAREALLVETIGELAALIDRVEAVSPVLDASRLALIQAGALVAGHVGAFENRMSTITENAKMRAVDHIAARTDAMARRTLDFQTRAMEDAARVVFQTEVGPSLQRLVVPLQRVADMATPARPLERWLTYAATASLASALTWTVAAWLWIW